MQRYPGTGPAGAGFVSSVDRVPWIRRPAVTLKLMTRELKLVALTAACSLLLKLFVGASVWKRPQPVRIRPGFPLRKQRSA